MPLYEYQCKKCKHRFEKIHQSYSDPRVKKCPECGGSVEQLLSAPAAHFKGTGWYATDYAKKSSGSEASGAEASGSAGSGSESGGDDSSASKAKEKTETKSATSDGKSSESSKESKPKAESKKKK